MLWSQFNKNFTKGYDETLGTVTMAAFSSIPKCGQETSKKLFKKYICFADFYVNFKDK